MVADGTLEGFRTPGRHLRVTAEGIQAVKDQRETQPRPARDASPVLQNRRERLQELTLEAQEMRARRDLAKLQREEQEETARREAEAQARKEEAARRQAELELERERLDIQQAQEWVRQQQEEDERHDKWQAEQELAAFRSRWFDAAERAVRYKHILLDLSEAQSKEILDALETEIKTRTPQDECQMSVLLGRSLGALVEPIIAARTRQEERQRIADRALWRLSAFATDSEKAQASEAIRKALAAVPDDASDVELRAAAEGAVRPIQGVVERRLLDTRMLNWAISQLPWGSDDRDRARISRECREILADLPPDVSEVEAKEALEPTVTEVRREIEQRQAEKERQTRKANLIQQGVAEVSSYLVELKRDGEITTQEFLDSEFTSDLKAAVQTGLENGLTGKETTKEVQQKARAIIDRCLK
jgi:hypothetical protein